MCIAMLCRRCSFVSVSCRLDCQEVELPARWLGAVLVVWVVWVGWAGVFVAIFAAVVGFGFGLAVVIGFGRLERVGVVELARRWKEGNVDLLVDVVDDILIVIWER